MENKYLSVLHSLVAWLDGKKAVIYAIAAPTFSYLIVVHTITPELGALLTTILSVITGGALVVGATQSYKVSSPAQEKLGALIQDRKP